jgi:hypothetical protein
MFKQTLIALTSATAIGVGLAGSGLVSAPGSTFTFDQKLTAPDGAVLDIFGDSVALSDNIALVGAAGDTDNGPFSGSAYLFDVISGHLLQKLTAPDGEAFDGFGVSVALSGNTALVGALGDTDKGDARGSAYLFDVTTGRLLHKLTAPDGAADDRFGSSVALSGNTALVGASFGNGKEPDSGSAYLFEVTTGRLLHKLTAPDGGVGDNFGDSVTLNGNTALVGALGDDDNDSGSGSAYLFEVTTGRLLQQLTAPDGEAYDRFGRSVALNGNTALVGASGDDDKAPGSGSAYLFKK